MSEEKSVISLSASKLKTFCNCSYFFYLNYVLKIPQSEHSSLPKGTVSHLILEVLFTPRHRHLLPKIYKSRNVFKNKAILRMAKKYLEKANLFNQETLEEINGSVFVGLDNDFLCDGASHTQGEYEFSIPFKEFKLGGYMDKIAVYEDEVVIYDYKTNKAKFSGEEKTANTQAFIYLWAARHLFPNKKRYVLRFLFLKYPKNPIQEHEYTQEQIDGFSLWVDYIAQQIITFDEAKARSNFAADDKKRSWLCKAGKTWRCPYYNAFDYYFLIDKDKKVIKKSLDKKDLLPYVTKELKIETKKYEGCVRHIRNDEDNDFFANF